MKKSGKKFALCATKKINTCIRTLVLSEKKILNETKNHSLPLQVKWSVPNVLLILMWSHTRILMSYWFSCDLIPAYWCVIDSDVASFQLTNVLLILMWPISSILICYWFSCDLFTHTNALLILMVPHSPAYWCAMDSRVTLFQHTEVLLILRFLHSSILMCYWFSCDLITAY